MVTFEDYYNSDFRSDLQSVMASADFVPNHVADSEPALQPITISRSNPTVRAWSQEREELFAVALFFTVLVDQATPTSILFTHAFGR